MQPDEEGEKQKQKRRDREREISGNRMISAIHID